MGSIVESDVVNKFVGELKMVPDIHEGKYGRYVGGYVIFGCQGSMFSFCTQIMHSTHPRTGDFREYSKNGNLACVGCRKLGVRNFLVLVKM